MNKFFVILLLLLTLLSCSDNNLVFNGSNLTEVKLDSDFELISHKGEKKTIKDFKGRVVAIFLDLLVVLIYVLQQWLSLKILNQCWEKIQIN